MPFLQRMRELGEWSGARVEWPGKIFDPADARPRNIARR